MLHRDTFRWLNKHDSTTKEEKHHMKKNSHEGFLVLGHNNRMILLTTNELVVSHDQIVHDVTILRKSCCILNH